ncbi:SubName: Full=Related to VPS68-Protein involved in vacuolar protein sorting {ECO:0000313/EMBL:CCA75694.1} [Serendipita indica DSM 11827]|nr:SubName: Full=Related to VPS68-Protein involved in vacuolar protein sorting {ECO:0000313/EMBL:CCA75694.1} [Serendipita indica DSM 11827]
MIFSLEYIIILTVCTRPCHVLRRLRTLSARKATTRRSLRYCPVHVTFVDWIPGIFTTLGLLIINLIDKERLLSEGSYGGEPTIIWRARLFLFIGFALMAGGLAGSVSLLVLKYIIQNYEPRFQYYGYANVAQNVALMLAAVILWLAQHASSEYEYNLQL